MSKYVRILKATLAATAGSAALAALALPVLAAAPETPSYAVPANEEHIGGTVRSIDGKYAISVRDQRGFIDNVTLHKGTIINPTGLQLAPGQKVTIYGRPDGSAFVANEIDTPYQTLVVPYGPRVGPGFGFGFGGFGPFGFGGYGPFGYGPFGFGGQIGF